MIYRAEHPKPQFMRENWQNLNGDWNFELDPGSSWEERGLYKNVEPSVYYNHEK